MKQELKLKFLAFFILSITCFYNFYFSQLSFIDIPYRDSWQLISNSISDFFPLTWIFTPHNEHIISTTKLFVIFLYKATGWNVGIHLYLNYLLYLISLYLLYLFIKPSVEKKWHPVLIISFIFCFSDLNWENLTWEFQSTFHLCLLFSFASLLLLFKKNISSQDALFAVALNFLAVFSLSSAAVSSICVLLCFLFFRRNLSEFIKGIVAIGFFATAFVWYVLSRSGLLEGSERILPVHFPFWDFFFNLSSFGFGFEKYSYLLGIVCVLPIIFFLLKKRDSRLVTLAVFILSAIAVISVGRAGHEQLNIWSKGGRYFEIAMLLVPLSAALCLQGISNAYLKVICSLAIPIVGFANNWSFSNFTYIASQKTLGQQCVRQELKKPFRCVEIWGEVINDKLKTSKKISLSFTGKLN